MYQYTNVHLYFDYVTKDGSLHSGEGKAVVFTSDIDKYQPGNDFALTYSKKDPSMFIMEIDNASLKKPNKNN
ncbi:hypothetical protein [Pantoea anthophila]|uniref:hypothetical protein n=1 Tax=Pantoea anthophila TaxID=470931 RepID=UPI002DB8FFB7|nr:hypothetical protein [Pantoea anthophila]MEB6222019.1 hypothetical protein [Pantoea anthophila]